MDFTNLSNLKGLETMDFFFFNFNCEALFLCMGFTKFDDNFNVDLGFPLLEIF